MTDDCSRGVHLSEKQLVFVFMAGTVVAVVVFLCGVLVGRGVHDRRSASMEPAMITPAQIVSDGGIDAGAADPSGTADGSRERADLSYAARLGRTPPPEELPAPVAVPPAVSGRAPSGPPPDVPGDAAGADPEGAPFTVQVVAVTRRADADAIVKRLKTKGHDAFVVVPEADDPTGAFRVRVGSFKTRREAEALARRLAREERYKPWVTR